MTKFQSNIVLVLLLLSVTVQVSSSFTTVPISSTRQILLLSKSNVLPTIKMTIFQQQPSSIRYWSSSSQQAKQQQQQQQKKKSKNIRPILHELYASVRKEDPIHPENANNIRLPRISDVKLHVSTTQPSSSSSSSSISSSSTTIPFWKVLWQFTRPHTLIGSAMAVPALALLATPNPTITTTILSPVWVSAVLYATIPALLMNLYITGLNQITDIDIDKINKPYLPLVAGTLSKTNGIIIVLVSLFISLWMGSGFIGISTLLKSTDVKLYATTGLNIALWGSGILGTLYSLNPFRFKRYPVMAAFCIVAVRGMIINASFYTHMKAVLLTVAKATATVTTTTSISSSTTGIVSGFTNVLSILWNDTLCWYSSSFFALFGLVIALMKDVPDVIGDKLANIRTFSVRIGQEKIFYFMTLLLQSLFGYVSIQFILLAYNALSSTTNNNIGLVLSRIITSLAASTAAMSVRKEAKLINPTDSEQVYTYYMHLWKLFYL
jgi:homogentisate phytyltransferase / homogentisate geranylgeranyltransferase